MMDERIRTVTKSQIEAILKELEESGMPREFLEDDLAIPLEALSMKDADDLIKSFVSEEKLNETIERIRSSMKYIKIMYDESHLISPPSESTEQRNPTINIDERLIRVLEKIANQLELIERNLEKR